jgi:hypothetical protein
MIREDNERQYNKRLINPLRRTAPLDAYIYKQGTNKEDVKEIQDNMVVNKHIYSK